MSTVLTKPVLLDETGQAIVGKLQDIQQAIGGTGEFIPINIRVTTPPTKTIYLAGETLDLSGMVVTLVASNGGMYDVTGDCVFSPADGSTVTSSTTEVSISYTWYKDSTVFTAVQPIGIKELASIAVTTPPTQTEYYVGDELDLTGIVVTATYADGSTSVVTNDCVFSPAEGDVLAINDTTINISYTLGAITRTATQAITVEVPIYGAEWDGTATTAWTRTDLAEDFTNPSPALSSGTGSSPFDTISPWKDIRRVADSDGGELVEIPKFYYKWTKDGSHMKLQIANEQYSGFNVSPAHADRNDGQGERDVVYIGRYTSYKNGTYLKSVSGYVPTKNLYLNSEIRGWITNYLGSEFHYMDNAMYWTVAMLYLVEFADWDIRKTIGTGGGTSSNATPEVTGQTDSMQYHTGTIAASRTTKGHVQYRYIEDFWGNVSEFIDGIWKTSNGNDVFSTKNPADYATKSNAVKIGECGDNEHRGPVVSWDIPSNSDFSYSLRPKSWTDAYDYTIYDTDKYEEKKSTSTAYMKQATPEALEIWGLFSISTASEGSTEAGIRIMKLPNNS